MSPSRPPAPRAPRLAVASTVLALVTGARFVAAAPPSPVPSAVPAPARYGVVVVAEGAAAEAAWPLAQAVYARAELRPLRLGEEEARALAGDVPASAGERARELGELRAGVHGDDAASRALLATLVARIGVRAALVVSSSPEGVPHARVFDGDSATFDAASYAPDANGVSDAGVGLAWEGAARSLSRAFGAPVAGTSSAPLAAAPPADAARREEAHGRPFYVSPWFWGAIGAAALGAGAVFLTTRDNGPGTIHLQMQVPK